MVELNLLSNTPKSIRNIKQRKMTKSKKTIEVSRKYGREYFDGNRKYGYGGYYYDGRWKKKVKKIKNHYKLKSGSKVLDVGCAKGFLIKDLLDIGIDAYGVEISQYAINNCPKEVIGRLHKQNAISLPFDDNSFDLVLCINTLHNFNKKDCSKALKEINRVSKKNSFIQVDAYRNKNEKKIFLDWVLTAKYHDYTYKWVEFFYKNNYKGDWYWTIIEE